MGNYTTDDVLLEGSFPANLACENISTNEGIDSAPKLLPPIPFNDHSGRTSDFPLDCLGSHGQRAAEALHGMVQAPKGLCAQSTLCAMSTCVSGWGQIEAIHGQSTPLAAYFIAVAQSGERKTAVDSLAQKGIKVFEKETKKAVDQLRADAIDEGADPNEIPDANILVNDPTFEGLLRVLSRGPGFACLSNDDAASFFGGFSMTRDQKQKMCGGLSQLWSGTSINRARMHGQAEEISGSALSIGLMFQPYMIGQVFGDREMVEQGILARVLPCFPISTMGTRIFTDPNPSDVGAVGEFARRCFDVLANVQQARSAMMPSDDPFAATCPVLPLSQGARRVLIDLYNEIEVELASGGAYASIRAFAGRATENATRLAGIISLFDDVSASQVSKVAAEAGAQLARFYMSEFSHLITLAKTSRDHSSAAQLGAWLARQYGAGGIGHDKDVSQKGPREFRKAGTRRPLMEELAANRWIELLPPGTVVDDSERQAAFRVHPDIRGLL